MGSPKRKLVDLPAERSEAGRGESTERQSREKPGVLVVADNHLVRIMVQLGLERDGFDVWLAANGREAIELYRMHGESIDVVVLDLHMPILDGPATLNALRKLNPEVRGCFMSGETGDCGPEDLRQCGAVTVIAKPFHLDQLANTLRLLVQGVPGELRHPPAEG
jgi:CheY-like chemotaxis protein